MNFKDHNPMSISTKSDLNYGRLFRRRLKCINFTDDNEQKVMTVAHMTLCVSSCELKIKWSKTCIILLQFLQHLT
jgi:hypothetical protein